MARAGRLGVMGWEFEARAWAWVIQCRHRSPYSGESGLVPVLVITMGRRPWMWPGRLDVKSEDLILSWLRYWPASLCGCTTVARAYSGRAWAGHLAVVKAPPMRPVRCVPIRPRTVMAMASAHNSGGSEQLGLAPAVPRTPYGEYLLNMLNEREAKAEAKKPASSSSDSIAESPSQQKDVGEVVLYRRMEEVQANEDKAKLEDLMYLCIIEKFICQDVEMLAPMSGLVDAPAKNLPALTQGIHSKEAIELVREHLVAIMGPDGQTTFSNAVMKMSKLRMAQVYAASIMFGASASSSAASASPSSSGLPVQKGKRSLRKYVDSFDQQTMFSTARIVQ
eukprot:gene20195-26938_t